MKTAFISSAFALFASLATAAPAPRGLTSIPITFQGAPADTAFFTQTFPAGKGAAITNPLSISHIKTEGGANCVFYGIDGSVTYTGPGASTVDVGPPQTQVWGYCAAL